MFLVVSHKAWFDGVDGLVARALKGTSQFGAELDSLADYVDFGVRFVIICSLTSNSDIVANLL